MGSEEVSGNEEEARQAEQVVYPQGESAEEEEEAEDICGTIR